MLLFPYFHPICNIFSQSLSFTLTHLIENIQDVGKSILESYSRVLESMAFNIVARIEDLLYVDDLTKHSDRFPLVPMTVSVSGTPHKAIGTPRSFSPAPPLISPARGERSPFLRNNHNNIKPQCRGFGVRRVLSNYLGAESKETKIVSNSTVMNGSNPSSNKAEQPERQKKSHAMNGKTNWLVRLYSKAAISLYHLFYQHFFV